MKRNVTKAPTLLVLMFLPVEGVDTLVWAHDGSTGPGGQISPSSSGQFRPLMVGPSSRGSSCGHWGAKEASEQGGGGRALVTLWTHRSETLCCPGEALLRPH